MATLLPETTPAAPATPVDTATASQPRRVHSGLPTAAAASVPGFWDAVALVRPGANSLWAALGIVVLAILQWLLASTFLAVATGVAIAVMCGLAYREYRWIEQQHGNVVVRRALPNVVGRALPFGISWEIENRGDEWLVGEFRDVCPVQTLPRVCQHPFEIDGRGERVISTQEMRIPVRGRFHFHSIWINLLGPSGWVDVQRAYPLPASIKVLPEQFASREELLKDRGAEQLLRDKTTRTRQHGSGTEFESLTEFREGDDPRRIDWRATARIQRPVVRRFQVERHRDVMILIDCGRLMGTDTGSGTKLDRAVDSGLVLARVALKSGDRCGMALYDNSVRAYLPPVSGLPSLNTLAESVFDASSEFRETDFSSIFAMLQVRQAKRSLIVVISDLSDEETSQQVRASLAKLSQRHVVLLAALRTPLLERILLEPTTTLVDAAKKVVTLRLMKERQSALQSLKHSGVFVCDVEPSELTVPLINQFIALRQHNL